MYVSMGILDNGSEHIHSGVIATFQ